MQAQRQLARVRTSSCSQQKTKSCSRSLGQTNNESDEASGLAAELTGEDDGGAVKTDTRRHVIDTWLGFLGSAKPNFITRPRSFWGAFVLLDRGWG